MIHSLTSDIAFLLLRVPLGVYFALAGYNKVAGPGIKAFAQSQLENVPPIARNFGSLYLHALPVAEVMVGLMLVLGLFTRFSAVLIAFMLLSFLIAMMKPLNIVHLTAPVQSGPFDSNIFLLLLSIALVIVGGGRLALGNLVFGKGRLGKSIKPAESNTLNRTIAK